MVRRRLAAVLIGCALAVGALGGAGCGKSHDKVTRPPNSPQNQQDPTQGSPGANRGGTNSGDQGTNTNSGGSQNGSGAPSGSSGAPRREEGHLKGQGPDRTRRE